MNLVADEGVDRPVVERLRRDGHEVVYVAELSPSVADEEVLRHANAGNALSNFLIMHRRYAIAEFAIKQRIPTMSSGEDFALDGNLMT